MRRVNISALKNRLNKYLALAKDGEEIVICDQSLPVAKLVPFSPDDASDEELLLVAAGKMRLSKNPLNIDELLRVPTGTVASNEGIKALLADRDEGQVTRKRRREWRTSCSTSR